MKCQKLEVLLSCYLDGELSPEQSEQVTQHLSECSSCAQEYRTLRKNQLVLASLSRKEPSPDLWERIEKRVVTEQAEQVLPVRRRVWPMLRRGLLMAASIAVLLFFGIVAIGYFSHDEEAPPPQVSMRTFMEGHATFVSDHNPLSDKAAWAYVRSRALQSVVEKEHVGP
ncbi:MAG: anti-sigma factor [Candidatus Xenobia bacterium]